MYLNFCYCSRTWSLVLRYMLTLTYGRRCRCRCHRGRGRDLAGDVGACTGAASSYARGAGNKNSVCAGCDSVAGAA